MANTRKSLIFSAISLLLCCALLVGTTFAWFTDSVTNTGNKIQAGNLEVALLKDGVDISDSNTPVFSYDLWEPGYSTGANLAVKNNGSLALKYELVLQNVVTTKGIENVIDVIVGGKTVGTLADFMNGEVLVPGNLTAGATSDTYEIVLKMQKTAGNDYQNAVATFDILLRATQYTYEKDGFGSDQYDKDAVYMQKNVSYDETKTPEQNGAALQAAILSAKDGETIYVEKGEYDMPRGDTVLEGQSGWYFPITADNVSIIGEEGAVITGSEFSANGNWSSQNTVTIFGDNVTLEGFTIKCKMDCNKAIEVIGKNSTIRNVKVLCNDLLTHEEYLEDKGIEAGSETDYWEFYRNKLPDRSIIPEMSGTPCLITST